MSGLKQRHHKIIVKLKAHELSKNEAFDKILNLNKAKDTDLEREDWYKRLKSKDMLQNSTLSKYYAIVYGSLNDTGLMYKSFYYMDKKALARAV